MSIPGRRRAGPAPGPAREEASPALSVLTFEVGPYLFAVPAAAVRRILRAGEPLPERTQVVDAVGLLGERGVAATEGGECLLVLAGRDPGDPPVAVSASRAGDVRPLRPEWLLPFPGFIFRRENPFLGIVPPGTGAEGRPLFVLAGPERLLACAGDP